MDLWIYLKKNRMTIKEFCDLIGYSRNMISGIANNTKKPSKRLALIIEEKTNCEVKAMSLLKMQLRKTSQKTEQ